MYVFYNLGISSDDSFQRMLQRILNHQLYHQENILAFGSISSIRIMWILGKLLVLLEVSAVEYQSGWSEIAYLCLVAPRSRYPPEFGVDVFLCWLHPSHLTGAWRAEDMSLRSACQPDSPSSPAVLLAVINDPLGAVDDLEVRVRGL